MELRDLRTYFDTEQGVAQAVDGVSFTIKAGETLGVVGESGCGKSVTALSVLGLVPMPPGRNAGGEIHFAGKDLLKISDPELQAIRGNDIAMIFQEPMTALNPVFTVGDQIGETIQLHQRVDRATARAKTIQILEQVGIPSPESRVDAYPHQLSGGMRQRVMIAMAMCCTPALLIADEPTTALDVTIQAQILSLIRSLQEQMGMSVLLITHDLGVVAQTAHRVVVMYAGRIVETAPVEDLFAKPRHPYTIGLFRSLPDLAGDRDRLETIPGIVPAAWQFPSGCRFRTRCPLAREACAETAPEPVPIDGHPEHQVACHFLDEAADL